MQAGTMTMDTIGWCLFLYVAMAAWIGILAARWKGRSGWRWFAIGLLGSVFALVLLAMLAPRRREQRFEADMELQHLDGTGLLG